MLADPSQAKLLHQIKGRGRRRVEGMNKLEAEYASQLGILQMAGKVAWFKFEPLKFILAKDTTYTPDFMVMLADGTIEFREVKGFWEDDARVKIKVAAEMFPFTFVGVTKKDGVWKFEVF